ncbi:sensor histidine kinase [Edaphocola aurantiacus]|uniref:sensor histidine kinase n=1 Tax=Edaphocola aurantiacus TaxID=2601682 RepID=UPI001C96FE83|nr:histidine kinase [Edaphocola aurantiacus]
MNTIIRTSVYFVALVLAALWISCTSDVTKPAIIRLSPADQAYRDSINAIYFDVSYSNTDSARKLASLLRKMNDRYDPVISAVEYYNGLGFLYARIARNTDSARIYKDSLWYIIKHENVKAGNLIAEAFFCTGTYFHGREMYDSAIQNNLKALEYVKKSNDDFLERNIQSSLSELYAMREDYSKAAFYYEPKIRSALMFKMPVRDIIVLSNAYARTFNADNDSVRNIGQTCLMAAKHLYDSLQIESTIPQLFNNLGVYYFAINKPDSAFYYLYRCIDYSLKHSGETNMTELAYGKIVNYYLKKKEYAAALKIFEEMERNTDTARYSLNSKFLYYDLAYKIQLGMGNQAAMLGALQHYTEILKQVNSNVQNDRLLKYEEQMKQLANDNFIKAKEYEAKNQRYYVIFVTIIAIMTFAGSIYIFFYWKKKRLLEKMYWKQLDKRREFEHRNQLLEERTRISREMHDDLGTTLTSTLMAVEMIEMFPGQKEHLNMVRNTANNLHQQVNEIIWNLNTSNDNICSLNNYMISFARKFLAQANISLKSEERLDDEHKTIPSFQRRMIYLSFKELINNIVKHAHATEVKVYIETKGNNYHLNIEDNGVGMDTLPEDPEDIPYGSSGYGLGNISRNISRLFGTVRWRRANASGGTRVDIDMNILVA